MLSPVPWCYLRNKGHLSIEDDSNTPYILACVSSSVKAAVATRAPLLPLVLMFCLGIESEVLIQKQQSQAELSGMEELLAVARREHSKAILQLQQLSRKMASETDRAAELAEMGRAKMEEELNSSKKQLQSIQVERNLLLVSNRPLNVDMQKGYNFLSRCNINYSTPEIKTPL